MLKNKALGESMNPMSPLPNAAAALEKTTLMVLFQEGGQTYAIASHQVQEILPFVELFPIASHAAIAGLMNYHGTMIPVVDLSRLMQSRDSRPHFGTRIILLKATQTAPAIALLAERVIDTLTLHPENVAKVPPELDHAPYLGEIILQTQEVIRIFQPEGLRLFFSQANLYAERSNVLSTQL